MRRMIGLIAAIILALGAFAGCSETAKETSAVDIVYAKAQELGFDGTLAEFIEIIGRGAKGEPGAAGKDGADVN